VPAEVDGQHEPMERPATEVAGEQSRRLFTGIGDKMTFSEAQADRQVHARKLVYSALGEVKRLLSDLDIVPNMRDYANTETFRAARQRHADRVGRVVALQDELTAEARAIQMDCRKAVMA
jgi:hypothetical protein